MTKKYDGEKINGAVCGCDDAVVELTEAEIDKMIEDISDDERRVKNRSAKVKYYVCNVYGIAGESTHRTPRAALREKARREGDGWIVEDSEGNRWTTGPDGEPVKL